MSNSMQHPGQTTCPAWCQSKPHNNPDGSYDGPHTVAAVPALAGLVEGDHSTLVSVDLDDGHGAVIFLSAPNVSMTAYQAHSAAQALHLAARWAEDPSAAHANWCADHQSGQCCSEPIDVAPHAAVWLTQTEEGTRIIVDGPPTGLDLSIDEALDLSDAIRLLHEAARDHKPVRL